MSNVNLKESIINLFSNIYYNNSNLEKFNLTEHNFNSYFENYNLSNSDNSTKNKIDFSKTYTNDISSKTLEFSDKTTSYNKVTSPENKTSNNYSDEKILKYENISDNSEASNLEADNSKTNNLETDNSKASNLETDNSEISNPETDNSEISNPEIDNSKIDILQHNYNNQELSLDILKFNDFIKELNSEVDEDLIIVLMYDPNLINQISQILNVSNEDILNSLSELNLTISDMAVQENLISFIQDVFKFENYEMIISVDNIKEYMTSISNISTNVSYNEIIKTTSDNLPQLLDELQDFVPIIINNSEESSQVTTLLEELGGEVVETQNNIQYIQYNDSSLSQNFNSEQQHFTQYNMEFTEENFDFVSNGIAYPTEYSTNLGSVSNQTIGPKNINSLDIINQIMDKMKISFKVDTSEIKLLLRPDSLGEVSLKIYTQNGIVAAIFTAENQKVKEIIESNFSLLKDMLNEQGIEVSQLEVNVNDEENSSSFQQFAFEQEKSQTRVKNIIDKISNEEIEDSIQYVEDDQLISSSVNYSV